MRRSSPTLLLLRAVDASKVFLPFLLLQGGIADRLPDVLRLPWQLLVIVYSITRVHVVFFDWLTIRYQFSETGITHRSGWPIATTTHVRWPEVGALQVEQALIHQLLRRYRARVVLGAGGRNEVILDGLSAAEVSQLRRLHSRLAVAVTASDQDAPAKVIVFQARWNDYLLVSLSLGQFLLVVPFLLGAWSDVARVIGLPDARALLDRFLLSDGLLVVLFIVVAFGFGWARAWVSYSGYLVTKTETTFEASGGLLQRSSRQARIVDVRGIRIFQNPLMRVFGQYSLSLVLATAKGEFRSVVVLPVASWSTTARIAGEVLTGAEPTRPIASVPARSAAAVPLVCVLAGAAMLLFQLPWLAALAGVLGVLSLNLLSVHFIPPQVGTCWAHWRGLLWRRGYIMPAAGIRRIATWRRCWPSPSPRCWTRLTVMDRRPIGLWILDAPAALADALTEQVWSPSRRLTGS